MLEALPPPGRHRASRWLLVCGAVALLVVAAGFLLVWIDQSEMRAIRALPADRRAALYRRTLEDLESVCGTSHASDLDGHCREQARFILTFPECDEACTRLARWQLDGPTR
jgi:cytochrome b pre-mRNA-processing protein 3